MPDGDHGAARQAPRLTPEVMAATIRDVIRREIERATLPTDAAIDDGDGWRPYVPGSYTPQRTGAPAYDASSWRWFRLCDVAVLADLALVMFEWTEPGAPAIRYVATVPISRSTARSSRELKVRIRSDLRALLAPEDAYRGAPTNALPGWRHRVSRTWLDESTVVVRNPDYPDYPSPDELQKRLDRGWKLEGSEGRRKV